MAGPGDTLAQFVNQAPADARQAYGEYLADAEVARQVFQDLHGAAVPDEAMLPGPSWP